MISVKALVLSALTDARVALAETQAAVEPLVPYLETHLWVFIAVVLLGIGVAVHARWDVFRQGAAVMAGLIGCPTRIPRRAIIVRPRSR